MTSNPRFSNETTLRYFINFVMFILFFFVILSSLFLLYMPGGYQGGRNPRYNITIIFTRHVWHEIHFWTSVILSALLLIHIAIHRQWIKVVFFRMIRLSQISMQTRNYVRLFNILINGFSMLSFLVCIVSGFILANIPGGREAKFFEVLSFTRDVWKSIHTYSGIGMLTAVGFHLQIHWGWIKKTTNAFLGLRVFKHPIGHHLSVLRFMPNGTRFTCAVKRGGTTRAARCVGRHLI